MNTENAYIIGLRAITYIMNEEELLTRFIALTGLSEGDISERIEEKYFLSSCLEFLMSNEKDLIAFCHDSDIPPDSPMQAYQAFGGGNNWDSI